MKQIVDDAQRLGETFLGFSGQGCALRNTQESIGLTRAPAFGGFAHAQSAGEAAHAECNDEKEAEHDPVLGLVNVKGELRRNEEKVPAQGAERGHHEYRTTTQAERSKHDSEQKHQRDKQIFIVCRADI